MCHNQCYVNVLNKFNFQNTLRIKSRCSDTTVVVDESVSSLEKNNKKNWIERPHTHVSLENLRDMSPVS